MEVRVRAVPEQQVLTLTRVVRVGQIDDHIDAALTELSALAEGIASPFVLYHGEVSEEVANPVEVCLPVAQVDRALPEHVTARTEDAHTEAYVTITKAETDYPEIMAAYGELDEWVTARRRVTVSDSPREVYFADFTAARMDDLVCDVAFPIEGFVPFADDR